MIFSNIVIWSWSNSGAASRLAQRLALQISTAHPESRVSCFLHAENPFIELLRSKSIAVETIGGVATFRSMSAVMTDGFHRLRRFFQFFKSIGPSTVIVPLNFGTAWPLAPLLKLFGHRLVYFCHDATPHPGDYASMIQTFTQNRLLASASKIVFMSDHVKDNVINAKPDVAARSFVLPLNDIGWRYVENATPGQRMLRFIFVGRLLKYKGINILIEAVGMLEDRHDWHLTIAGEGSERARLAEHFKGNKKVDITQLGAVEDDAFDALLRNHDILLCPYIEASQSGVVSEAAYAAVPSIVTPVGALPQQIGDAGWVSQDVSALSFAAAMRYALENRDDVTAKKINALHSNANAPGKMNCSWLEHSLK